VLDGCSSTSLLVLSGALQKNTRCGTVVVRSGASGRLVPSAGSPGPAFFEAIQGSLFTTPPSWSRLSTRPRRPCVAMSFPRVPPPLTMTPALPFDNCRSFLQADVDVRSLDPMSNIQRKEGLGVCDSRVHQPSRGGGFSRLWFINRRRFLFVGNPPVSCRISF